MSTGPLRSLSDTALLVAWHRAMESARPDPVFRDPHAKQLAGERGEQIARRMRYGRAGAWTTIVRTVVYDELILKCLAAGVDTVLNLGAGLDSRPYRMDLPRTLHWIEVDLPDIISYKTAVLRDEQPRCHLERLALDLSACDERRAMFARINGQSARVLVITEGLIAYLPREQVIGLATDLHVQPHFASWLLEVASAMVIKKMEKLWGKNLAKAGAACQFAPEEGAAFYRTYGWEVDQYRSFFNEGRRLKREMPGASIMRIWQKLAPRAFERRLKQWESGIVLLTRA